MLVTLGDCDGLSDGDGVIVCERLGDVVSLGLAVALGVCDWLDEARWDTLGDPDGDGEMDSDGDCVCDAELVGDGVVDREEDMLCVTVDVRDIVWLGEPLELGLPDWLAVNEALEVTVMLGETDPPWLPDAVWETVWEMEGLLDDSWEGL